MDGAVWTVWTSVVSGLLVGGVYSAMAVGFSLAMGTAHTLNLAHTSLGLVCAYLAYFATRLLHVDPVLSLVAILPAMFVLGLGIFRALVEPTVKKARDPALATAVLTLGLSIVVENLISLVWTPTAKLITTGYSGKAIVLAGVPVQVSHLLAFGVAVLAVIGVYGFLHFTHPGRAVQAVAQNRDGAMLQGIRVGRVTALAFALGTATAGVGGVSLALLYAFNPVAYFEWLLFVFLIVTIGGAGAVLGSLYSGLIIGLFTGVAGAFIPQAWNNVVLFGLLILVLLIRPAGLFRR